MVGWPTWRVVVQNCIADTNFQNEGAQKLFHVVQEGVGAGEGRGGGAELNHMVEM